MQSFFFWLTVAGSLGAFASIILKPGPIEIVIVALLANCIFYGIRHFTKGNARQANLSTNP